MNDSDLDNGINLLDSAAGFNTGTLSVTLEVSHSRVAMPGVRL